MELPTTIGDRGEESDFCGDGLCADDETDVHCTGQVWLEVDADGDGDAVLALCGGVAKDMDDAGRGDDGVCVWGSHEGDDCRYMQLNRTQRERGSGLNSI